MSIDISHNDTAHPVRLTRWLHETRAIKTMHGLIYHSEFGFLPFWSDFQIDFVVLLIAIMGSSRLLLWRLDFGFFRLWGHLCCRWNVLRGWTAEICSGGSDVSPFRSWDFYYVCCRECITSLDIFKLVLTKWKSLYFYHELAEWHRFRSRTRLLKYFANALNKF